MIPAALPRLPAPAPICSLCREWPDLLKAGELPPMLSTLMQDINTMTGDIKDQTNLQGENLEKIDEEIGGAADNVELANE